jgi:hypothetical protein
VVGSFIPNDPYMSFYFLERCMEAFGCAVEDQLSDGKEEWSMLILGECVRVS